MLNALDCPVCGWQMRKCDMQRGSFSCPSCKERLRWKEVPGKYLVATGGGLLAFLIPYLAGVQGNGLLYLPFLLWLPINFGLGALLGLLFLELERDPGLDDGTILHLTGRPDSSSKS